jgi:ankyrin repeat protein
LDTTCALLPAGGDVDRRNQRGQTPLGGVAFKGYAAIAEKLLDHGAEIDADNGNGMTPLMFATMFGRTEIVELLKRLGANPGARNRYGLKASWLGTVSPFFKKLVGDAKKH